MTRPTDDELTREALALLSQEPPRAVGPSTPNLEPEFDDEYPTATSDPSEEATAASLLPSAAPLAIGPPSAASPTLAALEAIRHPQQKTTCETCLNSVWFSSPKEAKCYCRVMYMIAWSSQTPSQITHCDGLYLAQEEG